MSVAAYCPYNQNNSGINRHTTYNKKNEIHEQFTHDDKLTNPAHKNSNLVGISTSRIHRNTRQTSIKADFSGH